MNIDTMKIYWLNLSERDRLVLIIGGLITLVYLLYLLIYAPLIGAVDSKSQLWIEKKETLAWMQIQAKIKHPKRKTDSNLLSVFSNQLKQASFSQFSYQLQQAGENHVQLSFDSVPYVDCLTWLRRLNEHYTMAITELTAARTKVPGVVKLRIVAANQGKGL